MDENPLTEHERQVLVSRNLELFNQLEDQKQLVENLESQLKDTQDRLDQFQPRYDKLMAERNKLGRALYSLRESLNTSEMVESIGLSGQEEKLKNALRSIQLVSPPRLTNDPNIQDCCQRALSHYL